MTFGGFSISTIWLIEASKFLEDELTCYLSFEYRILLSPYVEYKIPKTKKLHISALFRGMIVYGSRKIHHKQSSCTPHSKGQRVRI